MRLNKEVDSLLHGGMWRPIMLGTLLFVAPGSASPPSKKAAPARNDAIAHRKRGNTHFSNRQYDKAIGQYREALALKQDTANTAHTYNNLGAALAHQGRYDDAIENYKKAIAQYNKALASHKTSATDKKVSFLKEQNALAHYNLGAAHFNREQYDNAVAEYQKVLAFNPRHAGAYEGLALAWFFKKNYRMAWQALNRSRQYGGTPDPAIVSALYSAAHKQK